MNMNHATLLHFSIQKDKNVYIFEFFPGSTWEEIQATLDDFKKQFEKLREDALQKEAEKNQEAQNA